MSKISKLKLGGVEYNFDMPQQAYDACRTAEESVQTCVESVETCAESVETCTEKAEQTERSAQTVRHMESDITSFDGRISRIEKISANVIECSPNCELVTDATNNYIKTVPENTAPFAEIKKLSGMTYKDENTLKHAKVTEIKSVGKNLLSVDPDGFRQHVTVNVLDNNSFTIDATTTEEAPLYEIWEGELEAGQYTISFDLDIKNNVTAGRPNELLIFTNNEVTSLFNKVGESFPSNYEHTFNVSNRSNIMIAFYANIVSAEYNNYKATFTNMQLEKGTVATEFKPYTEHTIVIPSAVQALDGYGVGVNDECYNYIDWDKKQFVKRVGSVDMGTLDWESGSVFYAEIDGRKIGNNAICSAYPVIPKHPDLMDNKSMSFNDVYDYLVYVKDTSYYPDVDAFKTAMSGEMLYYELATPEIIDISDIISADNYIAVEDHGTITAVNEHGCDTITEIVYQIKKQG